MTTLPEHVSARGVIVHGGGAVTVRATGSGSLSSLAVSPGAPVHRGQLVATLARAHRTIAVHAPVDGRVMTLLASPGGKLLPGAPLVAIDAVARPARAVLFVDSPRELARLAPGQHVDVAAIGGGHVVSIAPYPASAVDLVARFGTADVAGGSTWLVDVALDAPSQDVPALAPVSARVLVGRVRPYRLVFGGSR
jgi:pyruvate/2-oxoglutarate dehydrogenase complex dihydrolipoamide acyltransferase (E2) component